MIANLVPAPLSDAGLAFLAPGLLHQLGNQLFALQGFAQLMADDAGPLRERMLAAVARSGEMLRVLRTALGDAAPVRLQLEAALEPLVDMVRVALRERGHQVQWSTTLGGRSIPVDAGAVVAAVARGAHLLAGAVPDGMVGVFALVGDEIDDRAVIRIRFTPAAGALPFPLTTDALAAACTNAVADAGEGTCRPIADGIELSFPALRSLPPLRRDLPDEGSLR